MVLQSKSNFQSSLAMKSFLEMEIVLQFNLDYQKCIGDGDNSSIYIRVCWRCGVCRPQECVLNGECVSSI